MSTIFVSPCQAPQPTCREVCGNSNNCMFFPVKSLHIHISTIITSQLHVSQSITFTSTQKAIVIYILQSVPDFYSLSHTEKRVTILNKFKETLTLYNAGFHLRSDTEERNEGDSMSVLCKLCVTLFSLNMWEISTGKFLVVKCKDSTSLEIFLLPCSGQD